LGIQYCKVLHAIVSIHNMFIVNNQLDLPTKQKLELFDSTDSPILNYAAEVWGYHDARMLNKFFQSSVEKYYVSDF